MAASDNLHPAQFKFFPSSHRSMGGIPTHTVEAWAPEHADTEWASARPEERSRLHGSFLDPGHRPIASISWHHETGEIRGIYTVPEHQRQGLATAALQQARQAAEGTRGVRPPRHSTFRTDSGEAWARSTGERLPRRSSQ
jgi:GNAT superfamily N-acetyltransferase